MVLISNENCKATKDKCLGSHQKKIEKLKNDEGKQFFFLETEK